jgi:hypothetical protein
LNCGEAFEISYRNGDDEIYCQPLRQYVSGFMDVFTPDCLFYQACHNLTWRNSYLKLTQHARRKLGKPLA